MEVSISMGIFLEDYMSLDKLENAAQYKGVHAGVDLLLKEAAKIKADDYQTGKVVLDGDSVYMLVRAYNTHAAEGALMEAHEKYLDVMIMVEGEETIYVKSTDEMKNVTKPYDPAVEALLGTMDGDETPVRLTAGHFIVLFPQDAHSPACHTDGEQAVKKIIGKVRI